MAKLQHSVAAGLVVGVSFDQKAIELVKIQHSVTVELCLPIHVDPATFPAGTSERHLLV